MSEHSDCPFCNPKKDFVIRENQSAIIIASNPRKVIGHILVIPKRHVEKPWELGDSELIDIFSLIHLVQKTYFDYDASGTDMRENFRPFLPQSRLKVNHVHYHVIPRTFRDEIYEKVEKNETGLFVDISASEFESIVQKFQ